MNIDIKEVLELFVANLWSSALASLWQGVVSFIAVLERAEQEHPLRAMCHEGYSSLRRFTQERISHICLKEK